MPLLCIATTDPADHEQLLVRCSFTLRWTDGPFDAIYNTPASILNFSYKGISFPSD